MELAFETHSLRTTCENQDAACAEMGAGVAELLRKRLADLRAADSLDDLVAGTPRLSDDGATLMIALGEAYTMVLTPNHRKNPLTPEGKPDWSKVSRVKLVELRDHPR